jgi:hypothetical protein
VTVGRRAAAVRSVVDQAVLAKVREGRLRDESWPYGLRAVVLVGVLLTALTALLALFAGPIRGWSDLTVPNSLASSVPDDLVWVLIFLLAFCLALFVTAAVHGPWWMKALGLTALVMLLGVWSAATTTTRGLTVAVVAGAATIAVVAVLTVVRRRRGLGWWEFPVVLGLIGSVLALCLVDYAESERLTGFRLAPVFLDQTMNLLAFLVLPAAFAAGAAVAEIAVGLTVAAARTAQRQSRGRWPYVVLGAAVVLRLLQEGRRLWVLDPVRSGWIALLPAVGLVAAFTGLGWLITRLTPLDHVPVISLPDDLSRIAVPVGAAVIAMLLPVYVFVFGFQIVVSVNPRGAPGGFDPSPLIDRLVDGFRAVLGVLMVALAIWQARRGRAGLALVLGAAGLVLVGLAGRLLTGYRWALRIDPDALVSVTTLVIVVVLFVLLVRQTLSRDRALGLAALLVLAALLSVRSVITDPFSALLGYGGVAFVLFGVIWDFLTGSSWANADGRRIRQPVRVLLALGYPLLTITIVAADALIRRPRTFSDVTAFAELGELVLGTALLAAATVVVLSAVRADRPVA